MKKILALAAAFACAVASIQAQSPNRISYQVVVRNSSGVLVANGTNVGLRFTIRDGSAGGTVLYQETTTQSVNNAFGLIQFNIGSGSVSQGAWPSDAQWSAGAKFLQVEVDPTGGTSYEPC